MRSPSRVIAAHPQVRFHWSLPQVIQGPGNPSALPDENENGMDQKSQEELIRHIPTSNPSWASTPEDLIRKLPIPEIWNPSTPIVFADAPRKIRTDFTWKRGNRIVFGPDHTQTRTFAAKKPLPTKPAIANTLQYQPRAQKVTANVANPYDLSFLDPPSQPTPPEQSRQSAPPRQSPQPTPPKQTSQPAHQAREQRPTAAEPETPFEQPSQPVIAASTIEQSPENPVADLGPSPEERIQEALKSSDSAVASKQDHGANALDTFERANVLLREALAEIHSRSRAQEQKMKELLAQHEAEKKKMAEDAAADLARKGSELKELKARVDRYEKQLRKLPSDPDVLVDQLKELNKAANTVRQQNGELAAKNERLQRELERERDPHLRQSERLAKANELKRAQEEKKRQDELRHKRSLVRAEYTTFQAFCGTGARDMGRWARGVRKTQLHISLRTMNYWKSAAKKFDSFVEATKSKHASNSIQQIHRDRIFQTISSDLQAKAGEMERNIRSQQDMTDNFDILMAELKYDLHAMRRLWRALKPPYAPLPAVAAQQAVERTFDLRLSTQLDRAHFNLTQEMLSIKQASTRAYPITRAESLVLARRATAMKTSIQALRIVRELADAYEKTTKANWLSQQSHPSLAVTAVSKPLEALVAELRTQLDLGIHMFALDFKGSTRLGLFKSAELHQLYRQKSELYDLVYRNTLLAQQHGELEAAEADKLESSANRNCQQSRRHMDSLVFATGELGLRKWSNKLREENVQTKRQNVSVIGDSDPLGLLATPTFNKKAGLTKRERLALSRKTPSKPSDSLPESLDAVALDEVLAIDEAVTTPSNSPNVVVDNGMSDGDNAATTNLKSAETILGDGASGADNAVMMTPDRVEAVVRDEEPAAKQAVAPVDDLETFESFMDIFEPAPVFREKPTTRLSLPKPSYLNSRLPGRATPLKPSGVIQARKGVLPKPDYFLGRRQRRRLGLKPTHSLKHVFQTHSRDMSEQIWLAREQGSHEEKTTVPSCSLGNEAAVDLSSSDTTSGEIGNAAAATTAEKGLNPSTAGADASPAASQGTPRSEEAHVPLKYQIPAEALRDAFRASQASGAAFWKHSLYRGPADERITIYYCTKYDQAEKQARLFLDESVLGFDAEWEPGANSHSGSIKENMSLIQIASESRIALFQIASFYGDTAEDLMPPSLRKILETPSITKVGVNIAGDYSRLRKCFGIQGQGLFEISHLYKIVKYSATDPRKVDKKPTRLADQVQEILYLPLAKGAVRTSSWSKRLSTEQIEYAATDAYAGLRLYDALEARRKAMNPVPPRPAFYELQRPLIPGNGPVSPIKRSKATKSIVDRIIASTFDNRVANVNGGGFEIATERVAELQEEAQEMSESEDQFYDCPAYSSATSRSQLHPAVLASQPQPASRSQDPAHPDSRELVDAEQWITRWRASLPVDYKPRATASCLRAYALWIQALGIEEVAALLRDPPLAKTSVAQYVLEAVKHENLPYEPHRLREVVSLIHPKGLWRYTRVIESLRARERA